MPCPWSSWCQESPEIPPGKSLPNKPQYMFWVHVHVSKCGYTYTRRGLPTGQKPWFDPKSTSTFFLLLLQTPPLLVKAWLIHHACVCMHAHIPHMTSVSESIYTFVTDCAQRMWAHTVTVAIQVQTCWTFKANEGQSWYCSQSQKTEGREVGLDMDVCGCIPRHKLACLYFLSTVQLALSSNNADRL